MKSSSEHAASSPEVPPNDPLIEEIKQTAERLARDGASRGDLKILTRSMRELRYAFKVLSSYRDRRKVTVFGSARTATDLPVFEQAALFGKKMAEKDWMVITGAGGGIMEAGHIGSGRDHAIGLNIMLPFEQDANPVIADDPKLIHLRYFFTRKLLFVKECHAVALFPGGFGTLDEGFEVLTLMQTGKSSLVPMVFIDEQKGNYWRAWEDYVETHLLSRELISPEDLSLFCITDNVDEAVREIRDFYSVYHSMRFVNNQLVLRLKTTPPPDLIEKISDTFKDIVTRGTFQLSNALEEERNEPHLCDLPRLTFEFDRKQQGRLRQLINTINSEIDTTSAELYHPLPNVEEDIL